LRVGSRVAKRVGHASKLREHDKQRMEAATKPSNADDEAALRWRSSMNRAQVIVGIFAKF